MKNKITIVCCYNDRKQYGRLQASLAKQNTGYELIGMDNCSRQYASCSLALNAATARVETEYVILKSAADINKGYTCICQGIRETVKP